MQKTALATGELRVSISNLSDIPGVGKKMKQALIEHFGNEAVALKVIMDSRVDLVAAVPGIGDRQAVNIVKGAFEHEFGANSYTIMRSHDIRRIFESILDIIRGYTNTTYAKDKLVLYFPLPPDKIDVIRERQAYFADALEMAQGLTEDQKAQLRKNLGQVRALFKRIQHQRLDGRVVLTNDEKTFDRLVEEKVDKWCPVYILSEDESATDYAQGYDLVMYISPYGVYDDSLDLMENVEIIGKDWKVGDIIPEQTVSFYSKNYRVIDAACEIATIFKSIPSNTTVQQFIDGLDFESLTKVSELLDFIDESGSIAMGVNSELDRFRKSVKAFPTAIAEVEAWLNDEINSRISSSEVTLGGQQIISILQSADMDGADAGALRNMLPAEIVETFTITIQEAEDRLVNMLGLTPREADWVTGIISEEISLPVQMVVTRINELEDRLRRLFAEKQFRIIKKIAGELDQLKDPVDEAVQTLLEFDLFLAVGLFAREYDLHLPEISLEYSGVGVRNARNLFLVESMLKGKHGPVQPIDYAIGVTPIRPEGTNGENCAILSGANSGGKTTTIQTLAQIVTMAQTGLPVPAEEVHLRVFEELFFFYKSKGMVNAGAFETTLEQFADIVVSDRSKLVLFDEVEAITEPGSAANVIAGLIEILQDDPNSATVICSHLAREIKEVAQVPVRIDGIEAKGLNQELELIVDRTPRFGYLARSTPELIVERLAKLAKGPKKEVFSKILDHLTEARISS